MWLLLAVAHADEQHLVYDLLVSAARVGTREVEVHTYPRPGGERRVIEAVTHLAAAGHTLDARASGHSSPRAVSFSVALAMDDGLAEVQGTQLPTGEWRLDRTDGRGVTEQILRGTPVLTTLDLFDPGRTDLLHTPGALALVLAETGTVHPGTLGPGRPGVVVIGGVSHPVVRYPFTSTAGPSAWFDVDPQGVLIASEIDWYGVPLRANLRELPAPRSYGTIDDLGDPTVGEGAL